MTLVIPPVVPGPAVGQFLAGGAKEMLIDGAWCSAVSGETLPSHDPATGALLASVPAGAAADVDLAVAAGRRALRDGRWSGLTPSDRAKILWRIADLMEAHIDELAELETLDQGKPLYVGRWAEIPGAVEQFRYFAGQATKIEGSTIPSSINYQPQGKRVFAYTQKQPVGVVGAIVPWNSPLVLTAMNLAPALAAGCSVVLKPAENTSLTALRLGELALEAGLPPGVLNIVTGFGNAAGAALAAHADVDKISFTGSTATGRSIIDAAKGNLKKVSLELGGKSPVVICQDADLEAAIPGAANAIFFNAGQVCVAGSRLYVHRKVFDQVVAGITDIARSIQLGHGLQETTQMGPLVSTVQAERVSGYMQRASEAGATIVTGGDRPDPAGSFISPTVITDVDGSMEIVRDEVFGPVIVCAPFDDIAEVTELANDSNYGLAASVWTESLSLAHRLASDIEAGTVWINCHSMYDASLPIGGVKQSGWSRLSGQQAVDNFLITKTVCAVL